MPNDTAGREISATQPAILDDAGYDIAFENEPPSAERREKNRKQNRVAQRSYRSCIWEHNATSRADIATQVNA